MPPQGGGGQPVKHGAFARGFDGTVEGGDSQIGTDAQALLTFGTMGIDFVDHLGETALFEQGFAESKVKDFSVFWRWPGAFDGVEDVLGGAEVLLPKASTSATHPAPFGVIVIRVSVDAFFFQAVHVTPRPLGVWKSQAIGDRIYR